jgi:hypothetical protein
MTVVVGCRPTTPVPSVGAALNPRADSSAVEKAGAAGDGGVSLDAGRRAVAERRCEVSNDIDLESTSTYPAVLKVGTSNLANGLYTVVFADGHTATRGMNRPANCCHPLSPARIEAHARALARCCEIRLPDQRYTVDQANVAVTIGGRTCDHWLTERVWSANVTARRCREAAHALQHEVCALVEQGP